MDESIDNIIASIRENGTSFTWHARNHEKFTQEMVEKLIGQTFWMNAKEFGYNQLWSMKVTEANLIPDGSGINITCMPV